MITDTNIYHPYKDFRLSTKDAANGQKVRLWENVEGENRIKLRSTKIYDVAENTIERHTEKTYSKIPMVNASTKDKLLNFAIKDGDFLLEGKLKNGDICQITKLHGYPVEEAEYKRLGSLALRFCKKIEKYLYK